jgi:hypothetical protein
MPIIANLNSRQTPVTTGATGTQVIKFIDCPRVYVKAPDTTPTPITIKSNGTTPAGYTDLGVVDGKVKVQYDKEQKEVRTGLDEILRAVYVGKKTAGFEFNLSQFDDIVIGQLTGLTAVSLNSGSAAQFAVGSEDVVSKALVMVLQNKIDGKEWQFYHPAALMTFSMTDSGETTLVTGKAMLPAFLFNAIDTYMIQTIYS